MNALHTLSIGLFAALAGSALAAPEPSSSGQDINTTNSDQTEKVHGCWGDEHGNLEGGLFFLPIDQEAKEIIEAVELANRGVIDNRVDIVMVGDGYTAGEQDLFHANATTVFNSMFSYEPFTSYESYFRISQIEVISQESGVDNDPSQGINRNTALDMSYWCGNTERLLCVSVGKAYAAASAAPDIDQVIAIANSSKYGGAGYPSNNLGTTAGSNSAAAEIAIHELGHSLGDLADEYTYGGDVTYSGSELNPVDVSIYNRAQQLAQPTKWYRWMDTSMTGFDNPISTYEGGNYSQFGVFRPSNNSMMRSLARPFNLVSAERLLHQIYREVSPIDDGTPDGTLSLSSDTLWVLPMQPLDHDLHILWYLDGQLIVSAIQQTSLDLSTLSLDDGEHSVTVEVIDPTIWVRNEAIRDTHMTATRTYPIAGCIAAADMNGDGDLNFFDVSWFINSYLAEDMEADFTDDGLLNFFDISAFLVSFGSGGC